MLSALKMVRDDTYVEELYDDTRAAVAEAIAAAEAANFGEPVGEAGDGLQETKR